MFNVQTANLRGTLPWCGSGKFCPRLEQGKIEENIGVYCLQIDIVCFKEDLDI